MAVKTKKAAKSAQKKVGKAAPARKALKGTRSVAAKPSRAAAKSPAKKTPQRAKPKGSATKPAAKTVKAAAKKPLAKRVAAKPVAKALAKTGAKKAAAKSTALVTRKKAAPAVVASGVTTSTKRQFTRLPVNLMIDYQVLDQFLYDYATNLSLGGVFIRSSNPLPVGTKLRVQFSLPGLKQMVVTWGEVAHVVEERAKEGFTGMGIRFDDLDAGAKKLIDQLIGLAQSGAVNLADSPMQRVAKSAS